MAGDSRGDAVFSGKDKNEGCIAMGGLNRGKTSPYEGHTTRPQAGEKGGTLADPNTKLSLRDPLSIPDEGEGGSCRD